MLVAHAQVVEPHDTGMADALHDLVFLQEAAEGLVELVLALLVPRHLQHDERARLLALGEIQLGHRPAASRRMRR